MSVLNEETFLALAPTEWSEEMQRKYFGITAKEFAFSESETRQCEPDEREENSIEINPFTKETKEVRKIVKIPPQDISAFLYAIKFDPILKLWLVFTSDGDTKFSASSTEELQAQLGRLFTA